MLATLEGKICAGQNWGDLGKSLTLSGAWGCRTVGVADFFRPVRKIPHDIPFSQALVGVRVRTTSAQRTDRSLLPWPPTGLRRCQGRGGDTRRPEKLAERGRGPWPRQHVGANLKHQHCPGEPYHQGDRADEHQRGHVEPNPPAAPIPAAMLDRSTVTTACAVKRRSASTFSYVPPSSIAAPISR